MLVSDVYSELMHYTTFNGLRGIVSSGCMWATDASFLNDASEISHFFDVRLASVLFPVVRKRAIELARSPEILANMIKEGGVDKVADAETSMLVSNLRNATLSMNKPYVLSLCGASNDLVSHNGLLSQWRGYGTDGGFALVLDAKALEDALQKEAHTHHYMHVQMGDVFYQGIDPEIQSARADFEELENTVRIGVDRMLHGATAEETEDFYKAVTSLSCLCKHWGFWEEREVRVVVVPATAEVINAVPEPSLPPKTVKSFSRGSAEVPYVELFANPSSGVVPSKLPISRVIVGPHPDRHDRVARVKELLRSSGYDIRVTASDIPYLGR